MYSKIEPYLHTTGGIKLYINYGYNRKYNKIDIQIKQELIQDSFFIKDNAERYIEEQQYNFLSSEMRV